jgi:hypothetical protein
MGRTASEEDILALKTATKRVVHDLGGIVAAASCTRVGVSQLSDYGNVTSEKMIPADVALDLEMISGLPHITAELARRQGYQLVPSGDRPLHELIPALQRIAADNGALFGTAVHVLSGGRITPAERRVMATKLLDMIQAGQEALCALEEASDA